MNIFARCVLCLLILTASHASVAREYTSMEGLVCNKHTWEQFKKVCSADMICITYPFSDYSSDLSLEFDVRPSKTERSSCPKSHSQIDSSSDGFSFKIRKGGVAHATFQGEPHGYSLWGLMKFADGEQWKYQNSSGIESYQFAIKIRDANAIAGPREAAQRTKVEGEEKRFKALLGAKNPRQMFIGAVQYEDEGDSGRAKSIYRELLKRFPNSQEALQASQRLTSLRDVEAVGANTRAATNAIETLRNQNHEQCKNDSITCYSRCSAIGAWEARSKCERGCPICSR